MKKTKPEHIYFFHTSTHPFTPLTRIGSPSCFQLHPKCQEKPTHSVTHGGAQKKSGSMLPSSPLPANSPGRAITFPRDDTERIFLTPRTRTNAIPVRPQPSRPRPRPRLLACYWWVQAGPGRRRPLAGARSLAPSAHPHRPQLPAPRRVRPAPPPPQSRDDNPEPEAACRPAASGQRPPF